MRLPRFLLRSGVSAGICLFLASCSPKEHDAIVAKVGDTPITLSDYERLYMKSGVTKETGANASQPDREKFLDLMVKYHLKLEDAYGTQLDRRPDVVNELEQYKGSLAASYVTDRQITTPGMRRLYDQRNEEVRASHILISLAPNANPQDSAAAYAKAYDLIKQLKAGADFATLAKQNSQDPSAQVNGGDLYYFMAGQMVPPFEHAVFAMKPGEISNAPIRTSYGVHVIKVVDRKPAEGERNCSHIMIRFNTQNPAPEDTLTAFNRIKTLQDSIKAGVDFAALAQRHSEDPTSAPNGGDLGWFGRRR